MDLTTKAASYGLYLRGLLGNKLRTWTSYEELLDSNYQGTVTVRGGGRFTNYETKIEDIPGVITGWIEKGEKRSLITFNESAPDSDLIIQGEVKIDIYGFNLFYCTEPIKMRPAMWKAETAEGLEARLILEHFLDGPSMDNIKDLLDKYDGHVVEFSTYSKVLGNRNRNTIILEVRKY
jgi:hypothetical protein